MFAGRKAEPQYIVRRRDYFANMSEQLVAVVGLITLVGVSVAAFLWFSRRNRRKLDLRAIILGAITADLVFHVGGAFVDPMVIGFAPITLVTGWLVGAFAAIMTNWLTMLLLWAQRRGPNGA